MHLRIFTPHFSKFREFRTLHRPKRHASLKFPVKKKTFYFSKRTLRAGIACSDWLNETLIEQGYLIYHAFSLTVIQAPQITLIETDVQIKKRCWLLRANQNLGYKGYNSRQMFMIYNYLLGLRLLVSKAGVYKYVTVLWYFKGVTFLRLILELKYLEQGITKHK